MDYPFLFRQEAWVISLIIFILIILAYLAGIVYRKKYYGVSQPKSNSVTMLETSVFAILGLMLAFIYSAAGTRFEDNRHVIVEEANCIGTAALRSDLYPDSARMHFRNDFKGYVELRIEYYSIGINTELALKNKERTDSVKNNLWSRASRLSKHTEYFIASQQMIPALNSMFDIATMRDFQYRALLPAPSSIMVVILVVFSFFIIGYNTTEKSTNAEKILLLCFTFIIISVIYLIMDMNRMQRGLIDTYVGQQKILELRDMFK